MIEKQKFCWDQVYDQNTQTLNLYGQSQWLQTMIKIGDIDIKQINITYCQMSDKDIEKMVMAKRNQRSHIFQKLQKLTLYSNFLSIYGMMKILFNFHFTHLTALSLSENLIGAFGIKILTKAKLPRLNKLWIARCRIGNQGLKHLLKGQWPELKILNLSFNKISLDGALEMQKCQWDHLEGLSILEDDKHCFPWISVNNFSILNKMEFSKEENEDTDRIRVKVDVRNLEVMENMKQIYEGSLVKIG